MKMRAELNCLRFVPIGGGTEPHTVLIYYRNKPVSVVGPGARGTTRPPYLHIFVTHNVVICQFFKYMSSFVWASVYYTYGGYATGVGKRFRTNSVSRDKIFRKVFGQY